MAGLQAPMAPRGPAARASIRYAATIVPIVLVQCGLQCRWRAMASVSCVLLLWQARRGVGAV